jgi:hypothetical protein
MSGEIILFSVNQLSTKRNPQDTVKETRQIF